MNRTTARYLVRDLALRAWGSPYRWGGDDPVAGFDCSGLMVELLKSVGILPRSGDWGAAALRERFKPQDVQAPCLGCLVLYGNDGKVSHVEMALDAYVSIGASGGGSKTQTEADAIAQDAYVKVRPIKGRSQDVIAYVDPFLLLSDAP